MLGYINFINSMRTNKKVIRLTESKLHKIISETLKRHINEKFGDEWNMDNDDEYDDGSYWNHGDIILEPGNGDSMTLYCGNVMVEVDGTTPLQDAVQLLYKELRKNG